jgi:transcriptional regulator NrdR family protein
MKCPKCRHSRYLTTRSEGFINVRIRDLKCRRCGYQWETKEEYEQKGRNIVMKVDKSDRYYNVHLRYMFDTKTVIKTYESNTKHKSPIVLDLFSELSV